MLNASPNITGARRSGFALVMSLGLVAFLLLLLLSFSLLTFVELGTATAAKQRLAARENARLGVMVALGKLQRRAGPDQRVTARAEVGASAHPQTQMWSGVWTDGTPAPGTAAPFWLVSGGRPDPATEPADDAVTIFPETPSTDGEPVRVPRETIRGPGDTAVGTFAFWVEDQSVKARLNRKRRTAEMDFLGSPTAAQNMAEALLDFPSQDTVFTALGPDSGRGRGRGGGEGPIPEETVGQIARAYTEQQIDLVLPGSGNTVRDKRHDFTVRSASVLENNLHGGLKTNLTGRTRTELETLLAADDHSGDHYLGRDYLRFFNLDPETGQLLPQNGTPDATDPVKSTRAANGDLVRTPVDDFYAYRSEATDGGDGIAGPVRTIMPVVSEVAFRLGAFHTRSDKKHRIRFHADVEFWNPYPFPIRMPAESRDRVFQVMMVPSEMGEPEDPDAEPQKLILSVEKIGGGRGRGGGAIVEELHTNLFDFDEELQSDPGSGGTAGTNNSVDETVIISWMVVDNVILRPGEVYHATTEKGNGLARDLGGYVLRPGGDREDPADYQVDPQHSLNQWSSWDEDEDVLYPVLERDDRINVSLRMPEGGITFRLIAFDGASGSQSPVFEETGNAWAEPVWEARHLYQVDNPPPLVLRGDEYSRATSGSYTANNFNIGFHFRLADQRIIGAEPDASELALGFDLRQPVWDYENPAVREIVEITTENPFAVAQTANLFDGTDLLADPASDTHSGGYARAFLFHAPQERPLSVGALHRLPLSYETVDYDVRPADAGDEPVQQRIGAPWGGPFNETFDKYFYTGVPADGWTPEQPLPVAALKTLGAPTAQNLRAPGAAANLLVEGGFNINSLSETAWAAMLGRTVHRWRYGGRSTDLDNAFLNLADATDNAMGELAGLSPDADLTDFDGNIEWDTSNLVYS